MRRLVVCALAGFVVAGCREDDGNTLGPLIPPPQHDASTGDAATDAPASDDAQPPSDGDAATSATAYLLVGTVVTPDTTFDGQVLVEGEKITCAQPGAACAARAASVGAATLDTGGGVIAPGLVDTHNHILFDVHDENDWAPLQLYANHDGWTKEARYAAMLDTIQCLASETGKPSWCPAKYAGAGNLRCELDKWGELKAILAGTTSVVALPGIASNCFASLARTVDTPYNRLGGGGANIDQVYTSAIFPPGSSADSACTAIQSGKGKAYLVHCGEGLPSDTKASSEFDTLAGLTSTTPGCFMNAATTVTHGVAFTAAQFATMAQKDMKLTWSPRSNVTLYGATADVPSALAAGVLIALGPDWSMGGSVNMLDEMRFADAWDNQHWGDKLSAKDLVTMATKNGAAVVSYGDRIGQIAEGYFADLVVVPKGAAATPYDALLAAKPKDVRLTMVGGRALYGDAALVPPPAGGAPACETLDVCGASKVLCVAEAGTSDKLGQSYADIKAILEAAMLDMDTTDKGDASVPYTFAPIAPLTGCN